MLPNVLQCWTLKNQMPLIPNMMAWTEWAKAHGPRQLGSPPLLNGKTGRASCTKSKYGAFAQHLECTKSISLAERCGMWTIPGRPFTGL